MLVRLTSEARHESRTKAIDEAAAALRIARDLLKRAGAPKATAAVRRAINSTEGAARHAALAPHRTARQEGRTDG